MTSNSGHSRRSSDTSQISDDFSQVLSENDICDHPASEDLCLIWGQLIGDWANQYKKRSAYIKVIFFSCN